MPNVYSEHVIPFTITAANLNLADTADQSIYTFNTNANAIRVPKSLLIGWAGGTGYTLGNHRVNLVRRSTERAAAATYDLSDLHQTPFLDFYMTHVGGSVNRRVSLLFRIPLLELGLSGILNITTGATTGAASSVVAFPEANKRFSIPNEFGKLSAHSNVTISGGTGNLTGQFAFEEYPAL